MKTELNKTGNCPHFSRPGSVGVFTVEDGMLQYDRNNFLQVDFRTKAKVEMVIKPISSFYKLPGMLGDRYINCLLYADDLVIFSRSAKNLQIILNKLESFCENAGLSVNLDKTKIMSFNNCGKSLNNYLFRYGADELEKVKSYKYLGLIMSPFGNFNLARQELKKVALKALYKLRKEMGNNFRENIKLTMKLFDALISPILFYASEV